MPNPENKMPVGDPDRFVTHGEFASFKAEDSKWKDAVMNKLDAMVSQQSWRSFLPVVLVLITVGTLVIAPIYADLSERKEAARDNLKTDQQQAIAIENAKTVNAATVKTLDRIHAWTVMNAEVDGRQNVDISELKGHDRELNTRLKNFDEDMTRVEGFMNGKAAIVAADVAELKALVISHDKYLNTHISNRFYMSDYEKLVAEPLDRIRDELTGMEKEVLAVAKTRYTAEEGRANEVLLRELTDRISHLEALIRGRK